MVKRTNSFDLKSIFISAAYSDSDSLSYESNIYSIESDPFSLEFNSLSSKLDPPSHESKLPFCEANPQFMNYLDSCAIDLHSCANNSKN